MSVKIVAKPLPNGVVPYEDITDSIVKKKVMLLNQNIASLSVQLAELQRAAIELQQRPMPKQKEIADIERYVAAAEASAESAAGSATSAGVSATNAGVSETSASGSATSAGTSATNAGTSATAANKAKLAAEGARDAAVPAAQTATEKAQEASDSADRAEAAAELAEGHLKWTRLFQIVASFISGATENVTCFGFVSVFEDSNGVKRPWIRIVGNFPEAYLKTYKFSFSLSDIPEVNGVSPSFGSVFIQHAFIGTENLDYRGTISTEVTNGGNNLEMTYIEGSYHHSWSIALDIIGNPVALEEE